MVNNETMIQKYLAYYASFNNDALKKDIMLFSDDLNFGETLFVLLSALKDSSTDEYFEIMWYAARSLTDLFDKEVSDITEEDISPILSSSTKSKSIFIKRWIKWIQKYHQKEEIKEKRNDNIQFINDLSYSDNYVCDPAITFSQLFSYWLYLHKDEYRYEYMSGTLLPAYRSLRQLHDVPFKSISLQTVEDFIKDESKAKKNRDLFLYRRLDQFAFHLQLIPYCRANEVKIDKLDSRKFKEITITKEQIQTLSDHIDDPNVCIALTLLTTGMKLRELLSLQQESCKEPFMLTAWNVIQMYQQKQYRYSYQKIMIEKAVKETSEKYLDIPLTPTMCRYAIMEEVRDE